MSATIKRVAADKLASILGSKIVERTKTVSAEGETTKQYTQTLLLLPKGIFACLPSPWNAELYVDEQLKEEFIAFVISETKPRDIAQAPAPLPNPMMGRLIIFPGRPLANRSSALSPKSLPISFQPMLIVHPDEPND